MIGINWFVLVVQVFEVFTAIIVISVEVLSMVRLPLVLVSKDRTRMDFQTQNSRRSLHLELLSAYTRLNRVQYVSDFNSTGGSVIAFSLERLDVAINTN